MFNIPSTLKEFDAMAKRIHNATINIVDNISKPEEPKQEGKKVKMKKWPDDGSVVHYRNLIDPLKSILNSGYNFIRKKQANGFDYDGYNIGKEEQKIFANPKTRLKEDYLAKEAKVGRNLIDVVLNIVFLLGIEQGRRTERVNIKNIEELTDTLEMYRRTNKDLRIKVDTLEGTILLKDLPDEIFESSLKDYVASKRLERIKKAKNDLLQDRNRTNFNPYLKSKAAFKDIAFKYLTLDEVFSKTSWEEYLLDKGWSYEEFVENCEKKKIKIKFGETK